MKLSELLSINLLEEKLESTIRKAVKPTGPAASKLIA